MFARGQTIACTRLTATVTVLVHQGHGPFTAMGTTTTTTVTAITTSYLCFGHLRFIALQAKYTYIICPSNTGIVGMTEQRGTAFVCCCVSRLTIIVDFVF